MLHVKDLMTKDVCLCSPDDSVEACAKAMRDCNIGAMPVSEKDRLVGMVTDRDIVIRALAQGKSPKDTKIREVMTNEIFYCYDDESLDKVEDYMSAKQVRRLPVVNRNKRLVGMITLRDLAVHKSGQPFAGEALAHISADIKADASETRKAARGHIPSHYEKTALDARARLHSSPGVPGGAKDTQLHYVAAFAAEPRAQKRPQTQH